MKAPAWITSSLTAGVAFAAAYFASRPPAQEPDAKAGVISRIPESALTPKASALASASQEAAIAYGVLRDDTLRGAVANPDLVAAIREIMAREGEDHCADTRLICLVEQLPAARLGELSGALEAHMDNEFIVRFVLGAWAERDASGALAWVQSQPALKNSGVRAFLSGWVRAKPDAALAWLDAQPLSTASGGLRSTVVEAMSETNPGAAFELMKSRGWLAQNPGALVKLVHNWGGADPQSALAGLRSALLEMGVQPMKSYPSSGGDVMRADQSFSILLRALLNGAYDRNPTEAAALLNALTPQEHEAGAAAFGSEVFSRDPQAGEALFTTHPDEKTRPLLLSLAAENPGMVLRLLGRIDDSDLRQQMVLRATSGHDRNGQALVPPESRAAVAAALEGITDQRQRGAAAGLLCQDNAASAPEWAAELWKNLPRDQQYAFGPGYFNGLADNSPDLALSAFRQSAPEVQAQALQTLCHTLARTRPAEALELVVQSPRGEESAKSAATLFAFWAQSDEAAALSALESHAGQLDLPAIVSNLADAGHFRTPGGFQLRRVTTDKVAAKIKELLSAP